KSAVVVAAPLLHFHCSWCLAGSPARKRRRDLPVTIGRRHAGSGVPAQLAGGWKSSANCSVPPEGTKEVTSMTYVVPAVTAAFTDDWCVPPNSSLHASSTRPPPHVPVETLTTVS